MSNFSSDQVRCSLVQDHSKNNSINYILTRADGTIVNEINIGQEEWKYRYPPEKKLFSWKFIDHTPDMRIKVQLRAFQEAFNSIEKVTKLKIDFQKDYTKQTDITVEWLESIESFDNKLSVLAHAWLYSPNSRKNGVMEFNDSPESKWFFTPLGWPVPAYRVDNVNYHKGQTDPRTGKLVMLASQPTVKIVMHEFGHVLGLRHDLIHKDSMMFPSVSRTYKNNKVIKKIFYWDSVSSIPRLTQDYGTAGILARIMDRWRSRRVRESTYKRYA